MTTTPIDDDLRSPTALRDPHAFHHRLRAHDPVHYSAASRAWIVTSHAEVCAGLKDYARLGSDRLGPLWAKMTEAQRPAMRQAFELLRGWMVFNDPPTHEALRDPVRRAFTPRATDRLEARVRSVVSDLLDDLARDDEHELVRSLAFPLPAIVIAELLGVPPEDRERFKTWSGKLAGLVFGAVEMPNRDAAASEAAAEFTEFFEWLIEKYERNPEDNLVSALIRARDEGESLTADQMVGACTMLLFAGHETTTGLISNGTVQLLENPSELERLRADRSLVSAAVEELLRYEGPAKAMVRHVLEPHERGGHRLETGDRVYLNLAAANRDSAVFADPDRLDLGRTPNPHVQFGLGIHVCLGAPLARLEGRIALQALVERFPKMRLRRSDLDWNTTLIGHTVRSVPLEIA